MKLRGKKILIISPEHWSHIFVSKHHYAIQLAKNGNRVFFLSPPSNAYQCVETGYNDLCLVNYKGFIRGLRFLPKVIRKIFVRNIFNNLQNLAGVKFDIIWSFDNSVFFDFDTLPKEIVKISHIVDLNQNFNLERAASSADFCFGVIPEIVSRLKKHNRHSYLLRHAVQLFPESKNTVDLPGKNPIKAMYIGNLEMNFINWEVFNKLAADYLEIDFIFIGANKSFESSLKAKLFQRKNVYFVPKLSSNEIPKYLNSADILLLNYTDGYFTNFASPHKMMEYIASGKLILSNYLKEYSILSEKGVFMAKNDDNYLQLFGYISNLVKSGSSKSYNEERNKFIEENTYFKKINQVEAIINRANANT